MNSQEAEIILAEEGVRQEAPHFCLLAYKYVPTNIRKLVLITGTAWRSQANPARKEHRHVTSQLLAPLGQKLP